MLLCLRMLEVLSIIYICYAAIVSPQTKTIWITDKGVFTYTPLSGVDALERFPAGLISSQPASDVSQTLNLDPGWPWGALTGGDPVSPSGGTSWLCSR